MDGQWTLLLARNTYQFLPLGSLLHFHLSQVHGPCRATHTHNMWSHPTFLPAASIHLDRLDMMKTSDSACTIGDGCRSPSPQFYLCTELGESTQHDQCFLFQTWHHRLHNLSSTTVPAGKHSEYWLKIHQGR